ncbi:ABC-2 type transport system permease protein [Clostridium tetanomorphum]|uniref:ABC transporter permease n=1 Tax=Clostridium tetanomorphum TaxID=1553 RepID=UPI00044FDA30|nr:ABC transporter permease [Clostridium tetanomorphum]KAJ51815.1 ABC-2 type transporter [Clostridium tetanomorphum DSM 665]MBP1865051.1 ABC-2 type transport system permease protein [Clostridium tetanomorphum]NRS83351.1 ABC-2 type transport system permease protein [Clostridium tetanomorphum]SQC01411.1 ABC-type multidrug transport system, permease component [Clostridium tetanomorphum]
MRNTFILFLNTIKIIFRKKRNIIVYFLLPMISFIITINVYSNKASQNEAMLIGIDNKDEKILSKDMIEYLRSTKKFKFIKVEDGDIKDVVAKRDVDCAIVFPEDFTQSIYDGNFKEIYMFSIKGEEATALIKKYSNYYMKNLLDISKASEGDLDKFNKIYNRYKYGEVKLVEKNIEDTALNKGVTYSGIGLLIMFIMFTTGNISRIMIKERRNRTYYRICASPVNSKTYVSGNVMANFFIVCIQVIAIIILVTKVLGISTYIPNTQLIFILLSFGVAAIGMNMVIMAFSESFAQAINLNTIVTIPTCMLGGCFWDLSLMPKHIQKISNFVPQKWTIDAIYKLQSGTSFSDIKMHIIIIWTFAITLFLISIYKMSISEKVENFV